MNILYGTSNGAEPLSEQVYVCNDEVWAVKMDDGTYRSTCVAYGDGIPLVECSDEIVNKYYCSLNNNQYGYGGHQKTALQEALNTLTKSHTKCPSNSCNPIDKWWIEVMLQEGIPEIQAERICTYGDDDQYYYLENET
eukprot:UN25329